MIIRIGKKSAKEINSPLSFLFELIEKYLIMAGPIPKDSMG
jgi:hypothetical protein